MLSLLKTITGTSPAAASTAALGQVIGSLQQAQALTIVATLTGATGGTLDVYLQTSHDGGTTWYDFVHYTQLAAGAAAATNVIHVSRASGKDATVIGSGTSPALAANTNTGGAWGDMMRVLCVAGVGTSVGATQTIRVAVHNPAR